MPAPKLVTPDEVARLLSVLERMDAGDECVAIAAKFEIAYSSARELMGRAERYRRGTALLVDEPTNIKGLELVGRLPRRRLAPEMKRYGVTTLKQIDGDWARCELLSFSGFGPATVDIIERVMGEFGLALSSEQIWKKRKDTSPKLEPPKHQGWANEKPRDFIVDQCRIVKGWLITAHELLIDGTESPKIYERLAYLLEHTPPLINPLVDEIMADREAAAKEKAAQRELQAAMEERRELNAEIARLTADIHEGKVIPFPVLHD